MSSANQVSGLFNKLILNILLFIACTYTAYAQNSQVINAQSAFSSNINQGKTDFLISSDNFYRTDSIFSFRSPMGYFPSLLYNFGEQSTAPLRFKTKEWIITGVSAGVTYILFKFDNDIDKWARVQKQEHRWVDIASPMVTQLGGNWGVYSIAGIGLISSVLENQKGVETSLLATQAMITSGVWVHLIKMMTGRERPEADYIFSKSKGGKWYGPFAQFDQDVAVKKPNSSFDSFPSGHAATAFSIATVFASRYSDIKAVPILSYSLATLVGVSRLTEHMHWSSDVFAGALLGFACGKQVISHYDKMHKNSAGPLTAKSKNKPELTLFQYNKQVGLSLKWQS